MRRGEIKHELKTFQIYEMSGTRKETVFLSHFTERSPSTYVKFRFHRCSGQVSVVDYLPNSCFNWLLRLHLHTHTRARAA
jgi:hypothetical protein